MATRSYKICTYNTQGLSLGRDFLSEILAIDADCYCLQRVPKEEPVSKVGYKVFRQSQFVGASLDLVTLTGSTKGSRQGRSPAQSAAYLAVEFEWGSVVNTLPPYDDQLEAPRPDRTSLADTRDYLAELFSRFGAGSIYVGDFHLSEEELQPYIPARYRNHLKQMNFQKQSGHLISLSKLVTSASLNVVVERVVDIPANSQNKHCPIVVEFTFDV